LESFETEPELLGDHRREFGARLVAHDLGKAQAGIRVCSLEHRLTEHVAAAALQLMFAPDLVGCLSRGDGDEEPPEVVSAAERGEGTGGGPIEEAVEDAQRNVFLIARPTRLGPKPKSCEMGKALEVPSPEVPRGLIHLSRPKCVDPVRDRS